MIRLVKNLLLFSIITIITKILTFAPFFQWPCMVKVLINGVEWNVAWLCWLTNSKLLPRFFHGHAHVVVRAIPANTRNIHDLRRIWMICLSFIFKISSFIFVNFTRTEWILVNCQQLKKSLISWPAKYLWKIILPL